MEVVHWSILSKNFVNIDLDTILTVTRQRCFPNRHTYITLGIRS